MLLAVGSKGQAVASTLQMGLDAAQNSQGARNLSQAFRETIDYPLPPPPRTFITLGS